jgi:hypothetical protein
MYMCLHAKSPLFLTDTNETRFSVWNFEKNSQISKFMKILPMEAELFHTDGRIDGHDEANSRFLQFCESAYKTIAFGKRVLFLNVNGLGFQLHCPVYHSTTTKCPKVGISLILR